MKKIEDLVGKLVTIYTDGGWEVSGEIVSTGPTGVILESDHLSYLIFKEKISCILEDLEHQEQLEGYPKAVKLPSKKDNSFPMNHIAYEESSMSLPENLLGEEYKSSDVDDFSVSFSAGKDTATNIKFGVTQDDSGDKDK